MKTILGTLAVLLATSSSQAGYLKTTLSIDGAENQIQYVGTGKETRYEFVSANSVRIITQYSSSGTNTGKSTIACEIRNLDQLSPTAVIKLNKFLDYSSADYMTLECTQQTAATSETLPANVDNLTVVVDLAKAPQNFKLTETNGSTITMENSGYTTINTVVTPKVKTP